MAINEQWIPIIAGVSSWVKDNLGPSKKELKIQIADLEKQVKTLSDGNATIVDNMSLIIQAIISQIKSDNNFTINAETIVFIGENCGTVDMPKTTLINSTVSEDVILGQLDASNDNIKNFFVSDEELALTRVTKPSERR